MRRELWKLIAEKWNKVLRKERKQEFSCFTFGDFISIIGNSSIAEQAGKGLTDNV